MFTAAPQPRAEGAPKPKAPVENIASATNPLRTGVFRGRAVTYVDIGGKPLLEGDILLDHVEPGPGKPSAPAGRGKPRAVAIAYQAFLWPKVSGVARIPYVVTAGSANLTNAIAQFNATFAGVIQLAPRAAEADFVNFTLETGNHSGVCFSNLGRVGGEQHVGGSADCAVGTLLHEIGHTLGLYHEHSRPDRNSFVTVSFANMIKGSKSNFDQLIDNYESLGPYDFASLMHYPAAAFTRNGKPVIESIPSGIPLSNTDGYTASDIDSVRRLYGAAPTATTITSNPPGLRVRVDGVTYTTPQVFNWPMNSTHSISVFGLAQTLGGKTFRYGRWSHTTAYSNSIVVTPGRGTPALPATSPAVTVYTAHFRELTPFSMTVLPAGAGTVATAPAPFTVPGLSGQFYYARQSVRLTATPNSGFGFLLWGSSGSPAISAPWSANPKTELGPGNVIAYFTSQPIYTMTTSPAGLGMLIDGQFWYGPQNFSSDFFPSWTPGSSHTVSTFTPQLPYSVNSRYRYLNWSDGGAMTHPYVAPANSAALTLRMRAQFVPIAYATPSCAANVTFSPSSPAGDGFYNTGTTVTVTATPTSGWSLTGWRDDLTGLTNPQTMIVRDEKLAVADYNTAATPLAATGFLPSSAAAGSGPFTLTINGAGFTPSSIVFVNNAFRFSNFVSPSQITVDLTNADVANAGAFPVGVANFPPGAPCSAYAPQGFFVTAP